MKCVFLFDTTGIMAQPWADAGFECHLYDLQNDDSVEGNIHRHFWDASSGNMPAMKDVYFVACWPPCTDLAVSGSRHMRNKGLRRLAMAITHFAVCTEYIEQLSPDTIWIIENPVSTISTYWRPADYHFHPWWYNRLVPEDSYTKRTNLWTSDNFKMPPIEVDDFLYIDADYIHHQPPGPERANIRSATPRGFTLATYKANKP